MKAIKFKISMALTPLNENLGHYRAAHLLRRTVFGANQSTIDAFASLTPTQALAQLFKDGLELPLPPIDPNTGTEWMSTGTTDANSENFELENYFIRWHLGQFFGGLSAEQDKLAYIFREKLVLFFHTHFTTKRSVVNNSRALYFQNQLFRKFAFDGFLPDGLNFKSLTVKISVDNAMLVFLDGRLNVKGSPNENYARELLELYSAGRGLEGANDNTGTEGDYGTFTEQDVQAGAKVLSGFDVDNDFSTIDPDTELPSGKIKGNGTIASQHDNLPKQLSNRLGSIVIEPNAELLINGEPTRESAIDEITQFIDAIYGQEETAKHICRKIYRFFGYHEIDEARQNGIITDLAQIFTDSNFSIQAVLEAFFSSLEFYEGNSGIEDDAYGSIIKSPIDLVVGHARKFEIELPDFLQNADEFYEITGFMMNKISDMGLNYYEPYEVAGYPAYHQFPIYYRGWITTSYLTQRYAYIQSVSSGMMDNNPITVMSPIEYVEKNIDFDLAANARDLVEEVCKHFLAVSANIAFDNTTSELSEERLNYFLNAFLLSFDIDEDPESTWTFRWTNGVDRETVSRQLQDLFNAVLQSPEYQLM
ncbi:DUF1800 family protein [Marivirga sp. S37H4]|uniref:DUF1800 family protein n=1 Tax=Marivirga aurantiaca TaxID=2802615 RepID=A0A935CB85_9BACT|nr:DUF1800 family protein [Marivirga aurantiaca]MBK6267176.1 DUF1800 family protein [Marivirga aurantiaca]